MFVALIVMVIVMNRPEVRQVRGSRAHRRGANEAGPMTRGEKNIIFVAAFALFLWFFSGPDRPLRGGRIDRLLERQDTVNERAVAIIASALLFVLPID